MPRITYSDWTVSQQLAMIRLTRDLYYKARQDPVLWAKVQAEKERLYATGRLQRPEEAKNMEGMDHE